MMAAVFTLRGEENPILERDAVVDGLTYSSACVVAWRNDVVMTLSSSLGPGVACAWTGGKLAVARPLSLRNEVPGWVRCRRQSSVFTLPDARIITPTACPAGRPWPYP